MIDTLKSICEQCVHLLNPKLDFIPEQPERHREIIFRDLKELVSAASLEQSKTVVILAGCIFESVLYFFIQTQTTFITARRGATFTFNPDVGLDNCVRIFNRYFSSILSIPDFVVDYRNMVHVNQELRYPPEACRNGAEDMLRLLNALIGKLTEYTKE
jgi:hypothetical protein